MYGNLLPLHDPLRLAEELAMLDCMSNGRIVSGFARGIPREHNVYSVPLRRFAGPLRGGLGDHLAGRGPRRSSRTRGGSGRIDDVAIWPRPVQQPHPPVWVPVTGSKETIEWAGRHNIPITPGLAAAARTARGHHPLLRAAASASTATGSRRTT